MRSHLQSQGMSGHSPGNTKTPLAAIRQPHLAQVVAPRGREVEELFRYDTRDGVVASVRGGHFAVARAREAGQGLCRVEREGLLEDCGVLAVVGW